VRYLLTEVDEDLVYMTQLSVPSLTIESSLTVNSICIWIYIG
jgi:hypothetical protein